MSGLAARAFVLLQRVLPRYLLTAIVYRVARIRSKPVKNFMIRRFVALYGIHTDEVRLPVPEGFACLNDFFIRELADGARPVDARDEAIVSPVDGTVSAAGRLREHSILQAKGISYTLRELLMADLAGAARFGNGRFATIYLAPHNYHRVHAAVPGKLVAARYVPGDLYSVNAETVARLPGLFRRNERLILHFDTPHGPAVTILVGALNVGSISTPWTGEIRPRRSGAVESLAIGDHATWAARGDLLGWFNMGSTVILLFPDGTCEWEDALVPGRALRMGESIGHYEGRLR